MPLGSKPECVKCGTRETPLWHSTEAGNLCNSCLEDERSSEVNLNTKNEEEDKGGSLKPTRRSTRITRYCNSKTISHKIVPKGKGRRNLFKKTPVKAPTATATPVTSNYVFYKGTYFQVGDVVSMQDIDGGIYYAQIRGLLTDQYCEKSAAVTWLLPTTASPPPDEGFNPETYIIGPDEDLPRKLECMEFVMHAPSDYYKLKNTPYPPSLTERGTGYIWTTLRNEIPTLKKGEKKTLVVSAAFGIAGEISQLGANDVTAGQNLRSFIACGRSGNFISFICCGIFIFLTAETARAGAAVIPACTYHMDGKDGKRMNLKDLNLNLLVEVKTNE